MRTLFVVIASVGVFLLLAAAFVHMITKGQRIHALAWVLLVLGAFGIFVK